MSGEAQRTHPTVQYRKTEAALILVTKDKQGNHHRQLVDSGADRELIGRHYAKRHSLKQHPLNRPLNIQFMDGSRGPKITHEVFMTHEFRATNGTREFRISYLVADIPEDLVLGVTWLQVANPDIDWTHGTFQWRTPHALKIKIRRARKQIIQGAILANDPPTWVQQEFPDVLTQLPVTDLPPHREGIDYAITLKTGFVPKREPNRSFSPEERKGFAELSAKETAAGRWRLSNSPQAVQMLWAAKAGGEKRPCHDYRPINKWIDDNGFPIPVIKNLMTDVAGSKFLTSLDLPKAYNQIRIKDTLTEDMLSFYCNGALYAPRVMQFGSKTAVAHFQYVITKILHDDIGRGVHAYLDNIIIYANTQEEHDRLVRSVLNRLRQHRLTIQPKKCEWRKQEVQFGGFLVSENGIRMDPVKIEAIRTWAPPRTGGPLAKTKVREFIGFCNFYRDCIEHFSEIALPLTALTSAKVLWSWGDKEEASWAMLKTAVLSAPVRTAYFQGVPMEMHTDACDEALGAVLSHRFACGHAQPIAFYSKKLNSAEQNYTVHDKELLAIVRALQFFREWVHGSPTPLKVWSDHKALQHFLHTTKLTQRHARWAETLSEYRFEIQHVAGRANRAADAISRKDATEVTAGGGQSPLTTSHFAGLAA